MTSFRTEVASNCVQPTINTFLSHSLFAIRNAPVISSDLSFTNLTHYTTTPHHTIWAFFCNPLQPACNTHSWFHSVSTKATIFLCFVHPHVNIMHLLLKCKAKKVHHYVQLSFVFARVLSIFKILHWVFYPPIFLHFHYIRSTFIMLNECPGYDTKQSDGEVPAMLELWGNRSTPSLPSLPGPLWPAVVAPDKGPIYGLNRINSILTLKWIVWVKLNSLK